MELSWRNPCHQRIGIVVAHEVDAARKVCKRREAQCSGRVGKGSDAAARTQVVVECERRVVVAHNHASATCDGECAFTTEQVGVFVAMHDAMCAYGVAFIDDDSASCEERMASTVMVAGYHDEQASVEHIEQCVDGRAVLFAGNIRRGAVHQVARDHDT
jgi:hypothetical protein